MPLRKAPDLPIRELIGPGAATMMTSPGVEQVVRETVDRDFDRIFEHELEYFQGKAGG